MKRNIIVSTGGRPTEETIELAVIASRVLGCSMINRKKRSILQLMDDHQSDIIIAGKQKYTLYRFGETLNPFFFHPNTAAFRVKHLLKGGSDPFVETCQLTNGNSFLDCTLGRATDCIIASHCVGESGKVVGIEKDREVHFITQMGLQHFSSQHPELQLAMRRINTVNEDSILFLRSQDDSTFDVVYLDPMFVQPIEESESFTSLRRVGAPGGLTNEWIEEGLRVANRRLVIKAHFTDPAFEKFGFTRIVRPNTKFHYGYLEK